MEAPSGGFPTAHCRESDATNLTTPFAKNARHPLSEIYRRDVKGLLVRIQTHSLKILDKDYFFVNSTEPV